MILEISIKEWTDKNVAKVSYSLNNSQCPKVMRLIMEVADKFELKMIKNKGL